MRNLDLPEADLITGRRLMEAGLPVVLSNRPSAVVITYEKVNEQEASRQ